MKKMRVLSCLVFCGILLLTTNITIVHAGSKIDIRYGSQYYPGEFVLKGYPQLWEKYNLKVEHILFSSGAENNQALISGNCDINCGADSKTAELFTVMGKKAVIIGTIQRGDRYSTVVRKGASYASWEELKGKTVATRFGTGAEQVLRRYFDLEKDLNWEDFKWVNMKIEDMPAALRAGSIEAFTAWEPTCAIAEAQGVGRLIRTYGDVSSVPVFLHTTAKFARNHRAEIVKFLAVHLDKFELIKDNPNKAAELAAKAASAKGYEVSVDVFSRVFKRIDFSLGIDSNVIAAVQDTTQFLYKEKKINKIPELVFDDSFLKEARALSMTKQGNK
jgi:ABC-type nitrate/sulfonate/bicarbonate transport system substrate-binding protein